MGKLFLLFAIMPIIEIALLLQVGGIIGGWNTVGIVIITAFLGATLVRQQGLQTYLNAQTKMQQGQIPSQEVAEGLLLLVAGVLLVTPGFVTDTIGFLFSLPMTRPFFAKWVSHALLSKFKVHSHYQFHQQHNPFEQNNSQSNHNPFEHNHSDNGDTFEGEYTDKSDAESRARLRGSRESSSSRDHKY
ncbi:FxsA family protein [Alteromonas sp. a30]|uniref:FxsA family protein n=1 Tax=Alteromonas sp. a30 TaxID=2730917 RepID=UPI00227F74C1|nr:FxsA family protein [Alteromonas sp. a30]MCY7294689.1 FxsA family protein [Alteromonas sp. a30]